MVAGSQPVRTTSPGRRTPATIRCMLASLRSSLRSSAGTARRWAGAGINRVGINRAGYLRKWLTLGIAIGIIAGVGAVVFYLALDYTGRFLLGYLADYQIPQPKGDGGNPGSHGYTRPWAIPLVTLCGALLSALIVAKFAPEAEGHGTDSAIEAVQTDPRAIRGRTIVVKTIASALTIGSGGSAARAGPPARSTSPMRTAASRCRFASAPASVRSSVRPWAARCWPPRSCTARTSITDRWSPASSPRRPPTPCSAQSSASTRYSGPSRRTSSFTNRCN